MKIYINDNYATLGVEIWIVDDNNGRKYIAEPISFVMKEYNPALIIEQQPTMKFTHEVAGQFLKALAEALDKRGVKTDNDHKLLGILEAKEVHLQDMRNLVFKYKESKA